MARFLQSLVTVRHIVTPAAQADAAAIEALAQSILAVGACIRPLLLRPAGFDPDALATRYEVVGDPLPYWAAVRARDLAPVAHEAVTAWIVEGDEKTAAALAQLAA